MTLSRALFVGLLVFLALAHAWGIWVSLRGGG